MYTDQSGQTEEFTDQKKRQEDFNLGYLITSYKIVITSITGKPYILWKSLFHCICSKFYKFKQMHNFVLTSDLMKAVRGQKHLSEAKEGMKELIY